MLWKQVDVCLPKAAGLGVTFKGSHNVQLISLVCQFSHTSLSERLCSLSTCGGRRGLGFTSSPNGLSDCWGQRELGVDLLLFSRYKWAAMKIYELLLQGMGVSIPANVMACLLFSHHPLCHATAESWWSTENEAFHWKSIGNWFGNWELRVWYFPSVWVVDVQYSSYIASFSLTSPRAQLLAFFYERGICLVLPNTDWYHTSFISLGVFFSRFLEMQRKNRPSSVDFPSVHILFE